MNLIVNILILSKVGKHKDIVEMREIGKKENGGVDIENRSLFSMMPR